MRKLYIYYFGLIVIIVFSIINNVLSGSFREGFNEGWDAADKGATEKELYWIGSHIKIEEKDEVGISIKDTISNGGVTIITNENVANIYLKDLELFKRIKPYEITLTVISFILTLLLIPLFYLLIRLFVNINKSLKRGEAFSIKVAKNLQVLGILLILLSLTASLVYYLQNKAASILLDGSQFEITKFIEVDYIYIIFGISLMFVAEYIKLGYKLQEEQSLTI